MSKKKRQFDIFLVFLDALDGTKETFVAIAIQCVLKSRDILVLAVASSVVAAQLPDDG